MQSRSTSYLLLLTLMWAALSFHWTVLGNNIVPTRVLEFSTPQTKGTVLGLVTVAGALMAMLIGPIAGIASDESRWRWGRRRPFLVVGMLGTSVSLFALIGAQSLWGFLLAMVAIQFFANFGGSPYTALIPDLVPDEQKGKATGFAGFADVSGRMIGAILGGLMVSLPAVAAVLAPVFFFLPASVRTHPMQPLIMLTVVLLLGAMVVTVMGVREEPAPATEVRRSGRFLRRAFVFDVRAERSFAWLLAARAMMMLGINSITTFLLYYIHDYLGVLDIEEANAKLGYLFAVSALTTLPSSLLIGYVIDRDQRRKRWVYVSSAGLAVVCVGFIAVQRFSEALFVGALFGVCYGLYFTSDWALALALLPKDGAAAKYMGIWGVAGTLPQVIAPGIGGLVLDVFNRMRPNSGYPAMLTLVVVYLIIATAMLRRVVEPPPVKELPLHFRTAAGATAATKPVSKSVDDRG